MRRKITAIFITVLVVLLILLINKCSTDPDLLTVSNQENPEKGVKESEIGKTGEVISIGDEPGFLDKVQKAITVQNSFNTEFEFYGLVVDQYGEPVQGAEVRIETRAYKRSIGLKLDYTRDDFIRKKEVIITNGKGRFEFAKGYGSGLTIEEISKEGYVSARGKKSIVFLSTSGAKHIPAPSNPTIYTMWKKAGAEPLIKEEFSFRFYNGDAAQGISLKRGKWIKTDTSNADLIVTASMGELNPERRNQFDWIVTITAVKGGLIETNDVFSFEAPESGYAESYSYSQQADEGDWSSSMSDKSFYVKAQGGSVYASVKLDFNVHPSGRFFSTMEILANPQGSRNLEYDPELRIKP